MAGLVKPKEYDIKDSNVELIGSDLDHRVKYNSAVTEPAWHDGKVGVEPGLLIWRIERFEVVPWPKAKYGTFLDGDSFIVLHSYQLGDQDDQPKLGHDIFFWLGAHTSQDEAGTAAYKTVELDTFLEGTATQHRETQANPSAEFLELFPRISLRRGGVESGFRRVEEEEPEQILTLLRVFKNPASGAKGLLVVEVDPVWQSLDEADVFVLDVGDKIWVWQGKTCSPMEKAKAAQVVHDMKLEKHVEAEVLSQTDSRSRVVVSLLGGGEGAPVDGFRARRPVTSAGQDESSSSSSSSSSPSSSPQRLFRLSDASGELTFNLVKDGGDGIGMSDLDGNDVFILDDAGRTIWVWQGAGASRQEKASWLKVAQMYVRYLQNTGSDASLIPIAKVSQGNESRGFMRAITV